MVSKTRGKPHFSASTTLINLTKKKMNGKEEKYSDFQVFTDHEQAVEDPRNMRREKCL
jgi:hypothetical protein